MGLLMWVIVIATSIWVLVDAKTIGIKKGQIQGMGDIGPWGWFFVCLLLWIVGFPFYLVKRSEFKRANGKQEGYLTYFRFYFFISAIIGALEVIDGIIAISTSSIGTINIFISLLEMFWVSFSIFAIINLKKSKNVPISYVSYNVFGWAYGIYLAIESQSKAPAMLPLWFSIFGLCFGIYFCLSSAFSLRQARMQKDQFQQA